MIELVKLILLAEVIVSKEEARCVISCVSLIVLMLQKKHELHEIHEDAAVFDYDASSFASNLISDAPDAFCTTSTGTLHASVLMKQVPVLSSRQ